MTPAVATESLGKRYGRRWALQNCSLRIPQGRVSALVGPNGAGKTTLLLLAMGLIEPSQGTVKVLGWNSRRDRVLMLPRIGFVAQERPLYRGFTVADMLEAGRRLNSRWDGAFACNRLERLGIGLRRRLSKLSVGQQAQVALSLALAKRPELLLLDEPVASLDPLARREFLEELMSSVAEEGFTVVLSSHVVADLERVCDHLVLLSASRLRLSGDIDELLEQHRLLVGPRASARAVYERHSVIEANHTERLSSLVVKVNGGVWDQAWEIHGLSLEDLVLSYMRSNREPEVVEDVPA